MLGIATLVMEQVRGPLPYHETALWLLGGVEVSVIGGGSSTWCDGAGSERWLPACLQVSRILSA